MKITVAKGRTNIGNGWDLQCQWLGLSVKGQIQAVEAKQGTRISGSDRSDLLKFLLFLNLVGKSLG